MSVSPWFIKNGPRETIPCMCWFWTLLQIFLTTNHYRYDKQDHYCGSQWKHKLWKQPRWIKTYFSTLSPRDKCDVLVQAGSKIRPKSMQILQTNDIANYSWYSQFLLAEMWYSHLLHLRRTTCSIVNQYKINHSRVCSSSNSNSKSSSRSSITSDKTKWQN